MLAVFAVLLAALLGAGVVAGASAWQWVLLLAVLVLPASELAVGLINHVLTLLMPPRVLPKLDFKDGISEDCATWSSCRACGPPRAPRCLLERLEIHYLANSDPHFRFALLTASPTRRNRRCPRMRVTSRPRSRGSRR